MTLKQIQEAIVSLEVGLKKEPGVTLLAKYQELQVRNASLRTLAEYLACGKQAKEQKNKVILYRCFQKYAEALKTAYVYGAPASDHDAKVREMFANKADEVAQHVNEYRSKEYEPDKDPFVEMLEKDVQEVARAYNALRDTVFPL